MSNWVLCIIQIIGLKFWRYENYFLLKIILRRDRTSSQKISKESTQNPWYFKNKENYFRFLDSKSQVDTRSMQLKNSESKRKKKERNQIFHFLETPLSRKHLSTLSDTTQSISFLCHQSQITLSSVVKLREIRRYVIIFTTFHFLLADKNAGCLLN